MCLSLTFLTLTQVSLPTALRIFSLPGLCSFPLSASSSLCTSNAPGPPPVLGASLDAYFQLQLLLPSA